MNTYPTVSIILPCYNVAPWLDAVVQSIKSQTLRDWEAIFVIDGSPDNSETILREYAASDIRIRIIVQQNQGQGASRDHGVLAARGEFIFFLDPDDLIPPNSLEVCVKRIRATNADMVIGDFVQFDDGVIGVAHNAKASQYFCTIFESMPEIFQRKHVDDFLFYHSVYFMVAWMRLIRRKTWVDFNIKAPKGLTMGEDFMTIKKLCFVSSCLTRVDDVVVYYRKRKGSATTKRSKKAFGIFDSFYFATEMYQDLGVGVREDSLLLDAFIAWFRTHMLKFTPVYYWPSFFKRQQYILKNIDISQYDLSLLTSGNYHYLMCARPGGIAHAFSWGFVSLFRFVPKYIFLKILKIFRTIAPSFLKKLLEIFLDWLCELQPSKGSKIVVLKIKYHLTGKR